MALDAEQCKTLAVVAATHAQWLRDNPDALGPVNDDGERDADSFGMYTLATSFLRLYYECIQAGIITLPGQPDKADQH